MNGTGLLRAVADHAPDEVRELLDEAADLERKAAANREQAAFLIALQAVAMAYRARNDEPTPLRVA